MTAANGYMILPAGSLPGTREIIDTCRRLFESKHMKLGTMSARTEVLRRRFD